MNTISRTITGLVAIIIGTFVIGMEFPNTISLIYGTIIITIGTIIFLNKNEDKIEKIKKGGKNK